MTGPHAPLPPNPPGRAVLREAARTLVERARREGALLPEEVTAELHRAGLAADLCRDVIRAAGGSLVLRSGRYHYVPAGRNRLRLRLRHDQREQQAVQRVVRRLIRHFQREEKVRQERRACQRVSFSQAVTVVTQDQQVLHLVTREISLSGVRLLSTSNLQGQQLRLWLPAAGSPARCFRVCMLWSAIVGDDLYENGGLFLEMLDDAEPAGAPEG